MQFCISQKKQLIGLITYIVCVFDMIIENTHNAPLYVKVKQIWTNNHNLNRRFIAVLYKLITFLSFNSIATNGHCNKLRNNQDVIIGKQ